MQGQVGNTGSHRDGHVALASLLEAAGTAITGVAAITGATGAGYPGGYSGAAGAETGEGGQFTVSRFVAAWTGSLLISLAKRAQQLKL